MSSWPVIGGGSTTSVFEVVNGVTVILSGANFGTARYVLERSLGSGVWMPVGGTTPVEISAASPQWRISVPGVYRLTLATGSPTPPANLLVVKECIGDPCDADCCDGVIEPVVSGVLSPGPIHPPVAVTFTAGAGNTFNAATQVLNIDPNAGPAWSGSNPAGFMTVVAAGTQGHTATFTFNWTHPSFIAALMAQATVDVQSLGGVHLYWAFP